MTSDWREPLQGRSPSGRGKRWQSGHETYKKGLNTKIHLAMDWHGIPLRVVVSEGSKADCKEICALINCLSAQTLLANRGYDADEIIETAVNAKMQSVIPHKKNRKVQRGYDKYVYKLRHNIENAFFHLKLVRNCNTLSGEVHFLLHFKFGAFHCGQI